VLESLPEHVWIETLRQMAVVKQYRNEDVQAMESKLKRKWIIY